MKPVQPRRTYPLLPRAQTHHLQLLWSLPGYLPFHYACESVGQPKVLCRAVGGDSLFVSQPLFNLFISRMNGLIARSWS